MPRYISMNSIISYISLAMMFATATIAVPFPARNEFNLLLRSTDTSTIATATKAGPVICVTYNNEAGGESTEDETGGEGDTPGEEKGDMAKNDGAPNIGRDSNLSSRASSMAKVESAAKAGPVKVCVTLGDQRDEKDVFDDGSIPPQELETEILKSVCCGSSNNSAPVSPPDSDVQAFCKQILEETPNVCKI